MAALKLDDSARRTELISACFTREEKDRIIKAAMARGIAPGILVRNAALAQAPAKETSAA